MLVSLEYEMGRKKIESFHRERVDKFTSRYKEQISRHEQEEARAKSKIEELELQEKQLEFGLKKSTDRLLDL